MMRHTAGYAMGFAALFFSIVAIMVGATSLFYMGTAVIVTILAGRLQAYLSVRYLRLERIAPSSVTAGQLVTVEVIVWSERKLRRPLITIFDNLPSRMGVVDRTPSLPIAPAYDLPVRTQYKFRPQRRGRFQWHGLAVRGTDALGLATISQVYGTEETELVVLPRPIPLQIELPLVAGFGLSEAGTGRASGGIEPKGVREYSPGDSVRHIHWPSSARMRTLIVKEFEAGSQTVVGLVFQRTRGSDLHDDDRNGENREPLSSLDLMCGHILTIADELRRAGAEFVLPQLEAPAERIRGAGRSEQLQSMLALTQADKTTSLGEELIGSSQIAGSGSMFYVMCILEEATLPSAISQVVQTGKGVTVLVYDASAFGGRKFLGDVKESVSPAFLDALTSAGAEVVLVPTASALLGRPNA